MSAIAKILRRVIVARVTFHSAEDYDLVLRRYVWRGGRAVGEDADATQESLSKCPVSVLIGGYGVISKAVEENDTIVAQVAGDDKLLSNLSSDGGRLLFVRRTQTAAVLDRLAELKAAVVAVECVDIKTGDATDDHAADIYARHITMRNALRPDERGTALACMIFRRSRMAVLGVMLAVLLANFLVSRNIGDKYSLRRRELTALQVKAGRRDDSSRLRQQAVAEFNRTLPYRYAWLGDRIGAAVPSGVTLLALGIQPRRKAVEQDKAPQLAIGMVTIKGEAERSADISEFVTALHAAGISHDIKLSSVDKERETGLSVFHIDMTL